MIGGYYLSMKELFAEVISKYEDDLLTLQTDKLFQKLKMNDVDFNKNISKLIITQKNKRRRVFEVHKKTIEDLALGYLKKRLDNSFGIKYPNRRTIMRECFSIIETLNDISDFVIFKIDFKDFFESISVAKVYEKYIKYSKLYRYEKDLIEELSIKYKYCSAGFPTSNALIEIISREFDSILKSKLHGLGLVFYSRYVDDCLIILNNFIDRISLMKIVTDTISEVFTSSKVKLNSNKVSFLSSSSNANSAFSYLGYLFVYKKESGGNGKEKSYFQYGIAPDKLKKLRNRFVRVVEDFKKNQNVELFRQRLLFHSSRVVFYNARKSKYMTSTEWDCIGIISSYCELRPYINNKNKIEKNTWDFFSYEIFKLIKSIIGTMPYFLRGNPEGYILKNRMVRNRSITFQPNIGWSREYLISMILKIDTSTTVYKKSYRELVSKYVEWMYI